MKNLVYGLAVCFLLSGFAAWAGKVVPTTTPVAGAPSTIAAPKPLPPDVKAARDKWLDAEVQLVQAGHDYDMVKLKHQEENEQKCLAEAQAKKDTAKVAKYQSKLAAIGKTHADRDKILSLKLDRIKEMRADDKIDALNDTDQIKALQEDIKAQWQSTK